MRNLILQILRECPTRYHESLPVELMLLESIMVVTMVQDGVLRIKKVLNLSDFTHVIEVLQPYML